MLPPAQKTGSIVLLAALALASAGCETTEHRTPVPEETLQVRRSEGGATWRVLDAEGDLVGHLARFGDDGDDAHFVVRDPWQQDLGMIDALGRAFRYLPHHAEPAWVGTGTVRAGAARILGCEDVTLLEGSSSSTDVEPAEGPR